MVGNAKKRRKIRIAMVAPPFGANGGPEVVVQNLTEALRALGVDVTLFAPGDWNVGVSHRITIKKSLWNMGGFEKQDEKVRRNYIISTQVAVLSNQNAFDLIHLHSQRYAFSVAKNSKIPCLLSFHNKITEPIFQQLKETAIRTVALSKFQKGKNRVDAVIHNGVPVEEIAPSFEAGKYLIAVGRLDEQKGIDLAIKLALKSGKKLVILGRVGNSSKRQEYFNKKIKPYLDD
ncbi:MAG: glycosyltransferase, partial [Patescibacteria group bacterium]